MKILSVCAIGGALSATSASAVEFEKAVRLKAGGETIQLEQPGYAAPSLADIDGDGKKELLVGQFRDGKIRVYPSEGGTKFGKGEWLQAGGKAAKVPGVW